MNTQNSNNYGFSVGDTASCIKTASDAVVRQFAELSGDCNPVHLDDEYAQNTRFKRRIAHGLFCLGMVSNLLGTQLPGEGSILVKEAIDYLFPVYVGDTIETCVRIEAIDYVKNRVTVSFECKNTEEKVVLKGTAVVLVLPTPARS